MSWSIARPKVARFDKCEFDKCAFDICGFDNCSRRSKDWSGAGLILGVASTGPRPRDVAQGLTAVSGMSGTDRLAMVDARLAAGRAAAHPTVQQFLRFAAVGAVATAVHYAVLLGLKELL